MAEHTAGTRRYADVLAMASAQAARETAMPMLNSLSALTDEIVGRLYADYPFLDRRAQRLAVLDAAHSAVIFGIDSRREAASAVERAARQQLDGLVRRSQ